VTSPAVTLREVVADDLLTFFKHQRDPEANRMAEFPTRDLETFLAHWGRILADETVMTKTVLVDGAVAGNVVSWAHDGEHEVGYWLGREVWGKGVATRALSAFIELDTTRPLEAHVAEHNNASRRVLEKCGFVVIGEAHAPSEGGASKTLRLRLD
jgi:RimJ/RimL family protein N-acetyltransferase